MLATDGRCRFISQLATSHEVSGVCELLVVGNVTLGDRSKHYLRSIDPYDQCSSHFSHGLCNRNASVPFLLAAFGAIVVGFDINQ